MEHDEAKGADAVVEPTFAGLKGRDVLVAAAVLTLTGYGASAIGLMTSLLPVGAVGPLCFGGSLVGVYIGRKLLGDRIGDGERASMIGLIIANVIGLLLWVLAVAIVLLAAAALIVIIGAVTEVFEF